MILGDGAWDNFIPYEAKRTLINNAPTFLDETRDPETLKIDITFLVPAAFTLIFYGLELFVGVIQAFIFAILTLVFAIMAVSHGDHAHGEDKEGEHKQADIEGHLQRPPTDEIATAGN